jgi:D-alanyl-D-alanine carboxypeptidase (penicillin-binding protein 5/6)
VALLMPVVGRSELEAEVVYDGPVQAPVARGDVLGKLVIRRPELPETEVPLVAAADVPMAGFTGRVRTAAQVLLRQIDARAATGAGAPQ